MTRMKLRRCLQFQEMSGLTDKLEFVEEVVIMKIVLKQINIDMGLQEYEMLQGILKVDNGLRILHMI